ncbi:MAG: DNA-binding response regulator, partial [Chloroflexota bacterium]
MDRSDRENTQMNGLLIALVEDEANIAEVVQLYLKRAGYRVQVISDGQAALESFERQMPDLVILDIMLPQVDGFAITRWLRDRGDVPIILLTSRRLEADRIAGLEMGADDYVVKPFSPQELVSRVRAVLRRARGSEQSGAETALAFEDLSIDPQTRSVISRGQPLTLTVKEFDLLLH